MKTLIIGGGLSGLAVANMLEARGHDYLLVEARARFGGRILTDHHDGVGFDLGPAWFWPGQPRIDALIKRLGLEKFDQYANGDLMYEDGSGLANRTRGFNPMQGSWRVQNGFGTLTQALSSPLPSNRCRLNSAVTALTQTDAGITAVFEQGEVVIVDCVVLAMPPRVAATIKFTPALPAATTNTMRNIATWMAGQAKAIAVYDTPFWRDKGLSGDASSRRGPMVEVHDASPASGGPYALFGFIGVPPAARADETALRQQLLAQLTRLFGDQAATPAHLFVKDWAFDTFTSTEADKAPLYTHPTYGMPAAFANLWHGKLHFAGTEVAPAFGGYLEGALEAAANAVKTLTAH